MPPIVSGKFTMEGWWYSVFDQKLLHVNNVVAEVGVYMTLPLRPSTVVVGGQVCIGSQASCAAGLSAKTIQGAAYGAPPPYCVSLFTHIRASTCTSPLTPSPPPLALSSRLFAVGIDMRTPQKGMKKGELVKDNFFLAMFTEVNVRKLLATVSDAFASPELLTSAQGLPAFVLNSGIYPIIETCASDTKVSNTDEPVALDRIECFARISYVQTLSIYAPIPLLVTHAEFASTSAPQQSGTV